MPWSILIAACAFGLSGIVAGGGAFLKAGETNAEIAGFKEWKRESGQYRIRQENRLDDVRRQIQDAIKKQAEERVRGETERRNIQRSLDRIIRKLERK